MLHWDDSVLHWDDSVLHWDDGVLRIVGKEERREQPSGHVDRIILRGRCTFYDFTISIHIDLFYSYSLVYDRMILSV